MSPRKSIRSAVCAAARRPLQRWTLVSHQFDLLRYDTSDLMIREGRAGLEIPIQYQHKATGAQLETVIVNF
jgi:hypothetical protein